MAFTYIGSASGTTSATLPAHQVGDILVGFVFRSGSTTVPTFPTAGGTVPDFSNSPLINIANGTALSARLSFFQATTNNHTTGTWTNATNCIWSVYRPDSGYVFNFQNVAAPTHGTGTSITYPALASSTVPNNSSVFLAFGATSATNSTIETPPSGFTLRGNVVGTGEIAVFDSIAPNGAGYTPSAISIGGTSNNWTGVCVELFEFKEFFQQIAAGGDDSYDTSGTYTSGTTTLRQGNSNALAVRMPNVTIPQGAKLTTNQGAGLFISGSAVPSGYSLGSLYGVAIDNCPSWSSTDHATTVTKTSASYTFNSAQFFVNGSLQTCGVSDANTKSIVDEILGRSGWVSGNAMGFVGDALGSNSWTTIASYEGNPAGAFFMYLPYVEKSIIIGNPINGTLTKTEVADTVSSGTKVTIQGTFTKTEVRDTLSSATTTALKGAVTSTLVSDTVTSVGVNTHFAALTKTETRDGISSTATIGSMAPVIGTFNKTEGRDTLSTTGGPIIQGALQSSSEATDTAVITGTLIIQANTSVTEIGDTLSSDSTIVDLSLHGNLIVTEKRDTLATAGHLGAHATVSITEARDTLNSQSNPTIKGAVTVTEHRDIIKFAVRDVPWLPSTDTSSRPYTKVVR